MHRYSNTQEEKWRKKKQQKQIYSTKVMDKWSKPTALRKTYTQTEETNRAREKKTISSNVDGRLIKKTVPVDRWSMCVHTSKLLEISLGLCSEETKRWIKQQKQQEPAAAKKKTKIKLGKIYALRRMLELKQNSYMDQPVDLVYFSNGIEFFIDLTWVWSFIYHSLWICSI